MLKPPIHSPRLEELLLQLPAGLREHVSQAQEKALELARIHGVDHQKAQLAALAHDIARGMKEAELLRRARLYELDLHPVEEQVPILLHGPVAANILRRECGIEDQEVLEAVWWHSTFNRGLGPVAKIVFLADKLDPHKVRGNSYLGEVDRLAQEDMNNAALFFLQEQLAAMIRKRQLIHPASVEGRNELLKLIKSPLASG